MVDQKTPEQDRGSETSSRVTSASILELVFSMLLKASFGLAPASPDDASEAATPQGEIADRERRAGYAVTLAPPDGPVRTEYWLVSGEVPQAEEERPEAEEKRLPATEQAEGRASDEQPDEAGELADAAELPSQDDALPGMDRVEAIPTWAGWSSLADRLEAHGPGAELAELLTNAEAAELNDAELIEATAACERLQSWAAAEQSRFLAELLRRRQGSAADRYLVDEVGARLALTRYGAEAKVGLAASLEGAPEVHDALTRGVIDTRKAQILTDQVATLPADRAREVQRRLLEDADTLTGAQLRERLRTAVLAIDAKQAGARHHKAKSERHVDLVPADDGMAWLSFYLSAEDATGAYTALDVMAGDRTAGEPRHVGARRADAFTDLMNGILNGGHLPDGQSLPLRQGCRPHLFVTVAASTLNGEDDLPGHLAGYGPVLASTARRIALRARRRVIYTDPATGAYLAGAETVTRAPTAATQVASPPTPPPPPDPSPPLTPAAAFTRATGLLCTDSYHPSSQLRRLVMERDRTCTFPGCRVPGWRCQVDHIDAFDPACSAWEQTVETNLHLLCLHHHQMKTAGWWTVRRDAITGITEWTSPTRHVYSCHPDPVDPTFHPRDLEGALTADTASTDIAGEQEQGESEGHGVGDGGATSEPAPPASPAATSEPAPPASPAATSEPAPPASPAATSE
ncbi:MAG: DUF222 domain-containing protein, partial [Actinomycetales bacterium]|nr:DUF222 domain-containing protein [Actinomycetales bacterium]